MSPPGSPPPGMIRLLLSLGLLGLLGLLFVAGLLGVGIDRHVLIPLEEYRTYRSEWKKQEDAKEAERLLANGWTVFRGPGGTPCWCPPPPPDWLARFRDSKRDVPAPADKIRK